LVGQPINKLLTIDSKRACGDSSCPLRGAQKHGHAAHHAVLTKYVYQDLFNRHNRSTLIFRLRLKFADISCASGILAKLEGYVVFVFGRRSRPKTNTTTIFSLLAT
jgi:hypothetical protein